NNGSERIAETGVGVKNMDTLADPVDMNPFHLLWKVIAALDPALPLQLDQHLHVKNDAAEFLPACRKACEVVARIFIWQLTGVEVAVEVLGKTNRREGTIRPGRLLAQYQPK